MIPTTGERAQTPVAGALSDGHGPESRAEDAAAAATLRSVAMEHKALMYCILVQILFVVLYVIVPADARAIVGWSNLAAGLAGAVVMFTLARTLFSTGIAICLSVLAFIPVVGIVVLLIIDRKAQNYLRARGIRVGLLGARGRDLPPIE